tara:strand:+ start:228 stop:905 length:678 start_codon:yes stop_codon:yes gene_type:complete
MKKIIFKTIVCVSFVAALTGCSSDDEPEIQSPTVTSETTLENVEITYTTIEIQGKVSSDGGSEIISRGVCWSSSQNPTVDDNKTTEASNTFTSTIENLDANTTYYFRVYATNSGGTSYGTQQSFNTSSLDGTMWDFELVYNNGQISHGDVTFYPNGTTLYDEPSDPGTYTSYGTWSLTGNTLTYILDSSSTNPYYEFTGAITGQTMSGTFTHYNGTQNWSATEYP